MEEELARLIDEIDSKFDVDGFYYVGSYFLGIEYSDVDIKVVVKDLGAVKKVFTENVNDCDLGFFWHTEIEGVTIDFHFVEDYNKIAYAVEVTKALRRNPDLLKKYDLARKEGKAAKSKLIEENIPINRYIVVALVKGELGEFLETLRDDVSTKFRVKGAIETKCPAHITLKYSFIRSDMSDIYAILEGISSNNKNCVFNVDGYDSFNTKTIFIKINPSSQLIDLQDTIYSEFSKVMPMKEFDYKMHFHMTLANNDISDKFNEILDYVSEVELPVEKCIVDNLCILKLVDSCWVIDKTFQLV